MAVAADVEAITLYFKEHLRVAGEVLEGEVHLNFPVLTSDNVEEVHVKLRGSVFTKISRQQGQTRVTKRERVELVRENVSIWQRGVFPPPGTHILVLPFRFVLPKYLLPSCESSGWNKSAIVMYSVEVVGVRPGIFTMNHRGQVPFPVLPFDARGADMCRSLKEGWNGPWRVIQKEDKIRRGIWGHYSDVKFVLTLPQIDVMPLFTDIPFTLNIVTVTKPMKKEDTPEDGQSIFPAPPLTPAEIEFRLKQDVNIRARSWTTSINGELVTYLGGLGPMKETNDLRFYENVQVDAREKVWIPLGDEKSDEKKQKGCWKQEINYSSTFKLSCPPTFGGGTMSVEYRMEMVVPFPGIGNDLKCDFPVRILSSLPDPASGDRWDGPPPEMDLPPAYFSANDLNHDEKNED